MTQNGPEHPEEPLTGRASVRSAPPLDRVTLIEPLAPGSGADPELASLIARAGELGVPGPLFSGILARVPDHARALLRAMIVSHAEGNVDHRLKEMIRIRLARNAGDPYFAGLRSRRAAELGLNEATIDAACGAYAEDPRFSEAEKLALSYAECMYRTPGELDEAFYARLKSHYSEAQIMELGAFIALHYGMQVFMGTLKANSPDG
jgi:alkylhydroperoxidase family enzyme